MNKTTILSATAATLAAAFLAMPLLAGSANASITSKLNNCRYDSKFKVISCCEKVLRSGSKPYWMVEQGGSCGSVAVCVGGGGGSKRPAITHVAVAKPKCFIKIQRDTPNDGGRTPETPNRPDTPTRGDNGNTKPF